MSADADSIGSAAADAAAAPLDLGGGGLEPICEAPGTYVYDR